MGQLIRPEGPQAHRHDYYDIDIRKSGLKIGALWRCDCGQLFSLADSQRDGLYWRQATEIEEREAHEITGLHCGDHRPVQHRDGKQPWCEQCGCDATGVHKSKMPGPGSKPAAGVRPSGTYRGGVQE